MELQELLVNPTPALSAQKATARSLAHARAGITIPFLELSIPTSTNYIGTALRSGLWEASYSITSITISKSLDGSSPQLSSSLIDTNLQLTSLKFGLPEALQHQTQSSGNTTTGEYHHGFEQPQEIRPPANGYPLNIGYTNDLISQAVTLSTAMNSNDQACVELPQS